jgi:hypothetical protein
LPLCKDDIQICEAFHIQKEEEEKDAVSQTLMAHTCHASYLGHRNPEDRSTRPAQTNNS